MNIIVGSAPDSWGVWFPEDPKQIHWQRFLDEVAETGYTWIELGPFGYLPTHLPTIKAELEKRNLKVSGTFVMAAFETPEGWPELERQVKQVCEQLVQLNAQYLILIDDSYSDLQTGALLIAPEMDETEWKHFTGTITKIAHIACNEYGLSLVFHPHAETHIEYEHQIERLLRETDPDLISLCLDVGHHAYRGGDPIRFIEKHHTRIKYIHLKSVDREIQKQVEDQHIAFAPAVAMGMFCEPSLGGVDFIQLKDMLLQIKFDGFAIVEQDMYPAPFDKPLLIAQRTHAYLKQIGFIK